MRHHKRIRLVVAASLAALMLLTTVSISVDLHYCQGRIKSFNFAGKAKNCHEIAASRSCPHHASAKQETARGCCLQKKGCCSNKTLHAQLLQDRFQASSDFKLGGNGPTLFIPTMAWASPVQESFPEPPYRNYKPPLIYRDIPILVQSFLL